MRQWGYVPPVPLHALVVLGCRVSAARGDGAWRRRVARAAQAWRSGLAPLVIASGGRIWEGRSEADAFAEALVEAGVARDAILRERRSRTTWQNARWSRALLPTGREPVGLVTCAFHMRRALACFQAAGIAAVALPAPHALVPPTERLYFTLRERVAWSLTRLHRAAHSLGSEGVA